MRVAFWNSGYQGGYGGAARVTHALLQRFEQHGVQTVLITNGQAGSNGPNPYFGALPPRVEVHVDTFPNLGQGFHWPKGYLIKMWRYGTAAVHLLRLLRRFRPDIVHLHFVSMDVFLLALYKRIFDYRLIVGFRGSDLWEARENRLTHLKVRLAVRSADAITSVSDHMTGCLRDQYDSRNVVCIPNGIEIDLAELQAGPAGGTPAVPADHFVYCGRLHPIKRVPLLVETFKRCIDAGCDRNLYLVGDGREREAVEQLIARLGVADRIFVLGALPRGQALSVVARARCLLLFSSDEGCPNVILEAMTLGVPAIAATIGGVPELVADGETGYLFPRDSPHAAEEHILRLARDPEHARALGQRAAQRALAHFSLATMVEKHIDLYRSVLGRARQARTPEPADSLAETP